MDRTYPLKRLALLSILILAPLPLFIHYASSPGWSWSSTTLYENSPGTHQGMCRMAYDFLRQDPAFGGSIFPDLNLILNYSGVDADRFGKGLGPDDVRNSLFSEHYFNPRPEINSGRATFAVGEHYRKLRTDLNDAGLNGRLPTTARSAAYAAHYIQDMTMPYHTMGVPSPRVPASGLDMAAFMQNPTRQAVMGPNTPATSDIANLVPIFRQDQRETNNRADWFEVWYYNGLSAQTKRSTHFTYEWDAVYTQPLPARGTSDLWFRTHTAEKFAEETARITRRYVDAGGAVFDPRSTLVGRLMGLGVQQTYTIWRASFSALRLAGLKLIKVPGKNQTYRTALTVMNQSGRETATNVSVEYVIMDSSYAPRRVAGPTVGALPPGPQTAVSPQELYIPNLMGKIRIILTGKFSNTPDSGFYQREIPVKALIQDLPDRNEDPARPPTIQVPEKAAAPDPVLGLWNTTDGGQAKIEAGTKGTFVGKVVRQGAFWKERNMKPGDEVWWLNRKTDGHYSGQVLVKGNFYQKVPLEVWVKGNSMSDSKNKVVATKAGP
jgi:hypothetical protein